MAGPENYIVFYSGQNFHGKSYKCFEDTPCLPAEINNRASSAIVHGKHSWYVYLDEWYEGKRALLKPGRYAEWEDLTGNNDISSCKISDGENLLVLYEHTNYEGKSMEIKKSVPNLGRFNNVASSAQVFGDGKFTLYEQEDYIGDKKTLASGNYPDPHFLPGNDNVSSVKAEF